jgi:hypothetical protein
LQPGFFLFTGNNVAAVRPMARTWDRGMYDGLATIPAKSGDQILLFGTGFGATNPLVPAGQVVDTAAPLVNAVKVFIDGKEAVVSYAGLTGVGLYQLNITVPSLADGGSSGDGAGGRGVDAVVRDVKVQGNAEVRSQKSEDGSKSQEPKVRRRETEPTCETKGQRTRLKTGVFTHLRSL